MNSNKINHALIDEYGLNEVTFKLIKLASKSNIEWNGPGLTNFFRGLRTPGGHISTR